MKRYAVISNKRIIDFIDSIEKPVYPSDQFGNKVIAIECDESVNESMYYDDSSKSFLKKENIKQPLKEPSIVELMQMVNDLRAELEIAEVIV